MGAPGPGWAHSSSHLSVCRSATATTAAMKLLVLAALVAIAAADYHDDTFHFSTGATGFQKGAAFLQAAPVLTKQIATPVLVKSIEEEIPVYHQQYAAVKQIAQPAYAQYSTLKFAQPLLAQQYSAKPTLFTQQYFAKPALIAQQYSAKPLFAQQYSAKPLFTQQYSAKPLIAQYSAKPLIAQQYSALSGASIYASAFNGPQYRILSQIQDQDPSGNYKLSYATENGIQASEQGTLIASAEGPVVAAQGSYSYTGPDGQVYSVSYIADENGFRASGDHLPTPPPIPAEILKSLEENARSSEQYDTQGRLIFKK